MKTQFKLNVLLYAPFLKINVVILIENNTDVMRLLMLQCVKCAFVTLSRPNATGLAKRKLIVFIFLGPKHT